MSDSPEVPGFKNYRVLFQSPDKDWALPLMIPDHVMVTNISTEKAARLRGRARNYRTRVFHFLASPTYYYL